MFVIDRKYTKQKMCPNITNITPISSVVDGLPISTQQELIMTEGEYLEALRLLQLSELWLKQGHTGDAHNAIITVMQLLKLETINE
jgi:hypothetical protein